MDKFLKGLLIWWAVVFVIGFFTAQDDLKMIERLFTSFVLGGVGASASYLPSKMLRRIVRRSRKTHKGAVRGKFDWQKPN